MGARGAFEGHVRDTSVRRVDIMVERWNEGRSQPEIAASESMDRTVLGLTITDRSPCRRCLVRRNAGGRD